MIEYLMPRLFGASVTPHGDFGWTGDGAGFFGKTRAGVSYNTEVALTYEAVFASLRVLSEGVGGVPLPCYEKDEDGERSVADADDLPIADIFKCQVNQKTTAGVFREGRVMHQVGWGNGFAEIERDNRGNPVWLNPIHPSRISKNRNQNNNEEFPYIVRNNDGSTIPMRGDEILHLPGCLSDDGIWGRAVLHYGRELIGGGLGISRANYANLGSGGQPKGILMAPTLGGQDARQKRAEFRKEWEEVHGNPEVNVPTIAILPPGATYQAVSALSPEANQIVQSQRLSKENIATLFGIPGYKIGADSKETAGTVEQKAIEFVVYSLMPWARKIEEQVNFKLLTPEQRRAYYFEHNFSGLLRGDPVARFNAYRIGFSIGVYSINFICRLENIPGIGPAGDQRFIPANMTTAQRAMDGDMGNGGAIGSDQSGLPADDPMDRETPDQGAGLLKRSDRNEFKSQLKMLERMLPERPMDHRHMAREALVDSLANVFKKESNAAQRAVSGDFDHWLSTFYAEHVAYVADRMRTPCNMLRIAGVHRWTDRYDLAEFLVAQSKQILISSYNSETPETFSRRLAAWPTDRANAVADEIMGAA